MESGGHERDGDWKRLYLSFHRTAFWQALGQTLQELWWHQNWTEDPRTRDVGIAPDRWTVRAVPDGQYAAVVSFLANFEEWIEVLYGTDRAADLLVDCPWEVDQIAGAVLASRRRLDVARAMCKSETSNNTVVVPEIIGRKMGPITFGLLRKLGRIRTYSKCERKLDKSDLAQLLLAGVDHRLGGFLFPRRGTMRVELSTRNGADLLSAGDALDVLHWVYTRVARSVIAPEALIRGIRNDQWFLWDYHQARRVLLGEAIDGR